MAVARPFRLVGSALLALCCAREQPEARSAAPSPEATASARTHASEATPAAPSNVVDTGSSNAPVASNPVAPLSDVEPLEVDTRRWVGTSCHPRARWSDDRGCVPLPGAPAIRCGNERERKITCDCAASDLMCVMRCAQLSKPHRVPHWAEPAPTGERADCRTQCRSDHAPSCLALGLALVSEKGQSSGEGARLIEKSCRLGYSPACEKLFPLYAVVPEARGSDFSARLEESRCARATEAVDACLHAAEAYEKGWGVGVSAAKAMRYARRACDMATARCRTLTRSRSAGQRDEAFRRCIAAEHAC